MNAKETTGLLRMVAAYCPAMSGQLGNSDMRKAWTQALGPIGFSDAVQAVNALAARPLEPGQTLWIQPGHVIAEVRRIRHKRIEQTEGKLTGAPREPGEYLEWLRRSRHQLGDGVYEAPEIRSTGHTIRELGD